MRLKGEYKDVIGFMKIMVFSYFLTGILLVLLAFLLYKLDLGEKPVYGAICGIYIVATFAAGFLVGKRKGHKKYLWGLLIGLLYFGVLVLLSLVMHKFVGANDRSAVVPLCMCLVGGTIGGMVS